MHPSPYLSSIIMPVLPKLQLPPNTHTHWTPPPPNPLLKMNTRKCRPRLQSQKYCTNDQTQSGAGHIKAFLKVIWIAFWLLSRWNPDEQPTNSLSGPLFLQTFPSPFHTDQCFTKDPSYSRFKTTFGSLLSSLKGGVTHHSVNTLETNWHQSPREQLSSAWSQN